LNITRIPPECDLSNLSFKLNLDSSNVTFSKPLPKIDSWQTQSIINCKITCSDQNESGVNGSSIFYRISNNNGMSWLPWTSAGLVSNTTFITAKTTQIFQDGLGNRIQWKAIDMVGNGPNCSQISQILVDTQDVFFSNPKPLISEVSKIENVEVSITISDNTSGVNGSSIEYSISKDNGSTWDDWTLVSDYSNNQSINIELNLTFPNGTANRLKWRACDIAGNGPKESDIYTINANTFKPKPTIKPNVNLLLPLNNSVLATKSVEFSWELIDSKISGVKYDLFLDSKNPPEKVEFENLDDTKLLVSNLENNKTYYWTVIPKIHGVVGKCLTGIWSFKINIDIQVPKVTLLSPSDNEIITAKNVTLKWAVIYNGSEDVTYDIYFDTKPNPNLFKSNHLEMKYNYIDLENDMIYYWKIVPKIVGISGQYSEVWSFSVKVYKPFPRVTLMYPLNGSRINSLQPTLSWSLNYNGSESVIYDLFLDTNPDPQERYDGIIQTFYTPTFELEAGNRYYWRIVPIVEDSIGPASEIWSFYIEFQDVPDFRFNLTVNPSNITIFPGQNRSIIALVRNLGSTDNEITLALDYTPVTGLEVIIIDPRMIEIDRNNIYKFSIVISTNLNISLKDMNITVTAISNRAQQYGQTVEKSAILTVKILELSNLDDVKEDNKEISFYNIFSIVIILIIIIIIIIIVFLLRIKKKREPIEPEAEQASSTEQQIQSQQPQQIAEEQQQQGLG
jgi:hypothetical protein